MPFCYYPDVISAEIRVRSLIMNQRKYGVEATRPVLIWVKALNEAYFIYSVYQP